jgi:hypothetical protein
MTDHPPAGFEELSIAKQFADIDREIARLAILCKIRIMHEETVNRIIHDDASVCGANNPIAFKKLRDLLMLHYGIRERAYETLGAAEAQAVINLVVSRIKERFDKLGIGPLE